MDMKLIRNTHTYYEAAAEQPVSFEVTQEAIIPDYCADAARIVSTDGAVLIHGRDLSPDGRLEISGTVRTSVLFVPESGKSAEAIQISIPFHTTWDGRDLSSGNRCTVKGSLRALDARLLNPRKMLLRGDIVLEITSYRQVSVPYCASVEQEEDCCLQVLPDAAETTVIADLRESGFQYVEELNLSAARKGIQEILDCRTALMPGETKLVGSKLVMKGIVRGEVLYRDETGELGRISQEFLFSQVAESGVGEDTATARASYQLAGYDYRVGREDDPEDRHTITMRLQIYAVTEIMERRSLSFLSDLYSLKGDIALDRQPLTIMENLENVTRKQAVREILSTPAAAQQIVDAWIRCGVCRLEEGGVLQTPIWLKALYLDENGSLLLSEKEALVRSDTDLSADYAPGVSVSASGEVMAAAVAEGIELRFTLDFSATTGQRSQKLCVSDARLEPDAEEGGPVPSLTLRRFPSGHKLWDIAKIHRATVEDILKANNLEQESDLQAGRLLLIPRGRS